MKNKEESSIDSLRGNISAPADRHVAARLSDETTSSLSRPGPTATAQIEQPALSLFPESLMEAVVNSANMEAAWKNVKANRGAPGPDGITITKFPDWLPLRWPEIRQQLLDGTYRPGPVRRKTIDKPAGGQRLLGIPNVIDRLIQQANAASANSPAAAGGFRWSVVCPSCGVTSAAGWATSAWRRS